MKIFKILSKRGLALFLVLMMCMSFLPATALAVEGAEVNPDEGTFCGIPAHTHTDECYRKELTCSLQETQEHKHNETCYIRETLICGQEESAGHTHGDGCWKPLTSEPINCKYPEDESHVHEAECYLPAVVELICDSTEEGHVHIANCWLELVCTQEESEGHQHDTECYQSGTSESPICGLEESDGHKHDENCCASTLICGSEAHVHSDECYKSQEGPSEKVTSFLDAVAVIPEEITPENITAAEEAITAARAAYNALSDEEKASENVKADLETLKAAEAALEEVKKPEEPVSFDPATGTLTITGMDTVTADDVASYKNGLINLIIQGNGNTTIDELVFRDCRQLKNVTIENVLTIGKQAFLSTTVENLTIKDVGSIADQAFYNSPKLKTVDISGVNTLGKDIFHVYSNVTALEEVSLSDIESIGDQVFKDCVLLHDLSLSNIGTIGFQAFMNCSHLEGLDLSGVETLGTSAFLGCTGLTSLDLDDVEIGETVFYGCTGLKTVTLKNIEAIGDYAFTGCTGLETVHMEKIGTIGTQAFSAYGKISACTALETVTMDEVTTIGKKAFYNCKALETVTMSNVDTIGQYAFQNCTGLNSVQMGTVRFIDNYAFWYCTNLTSIESLSNVTERIGGFAFYGCEKLTGLTVDDLTKMGYIGSNDEIMERVQAILAGKFQLDDAQSINRLEPDQGWDAYDVGRSDNWDQYDNGTQLMEQARWSAANSPTAEVKVDAYYTAEQQMDYIFVADLSASMAQLGNPNDANARFYDMQSKLLDMTGQLLGTPGYDCQVAIVTFGGFFNNNATSEAMEFTSNADDAKAYIEALEPLNENTDYVLGLNEVLKLAESHDAERNTVVVFLSDGRPTRDGETELKTVQQLAAYNEKIAGIAGQIKDAGVDGIYGVLHSPGESGVEHAQAAMEAVCEYVYRSTDTESFGRAMNQAFTSAYGSHVVTIPVGEAFDAVDHTINVSSGEAVYDPDTHTITWTISGMPFTQHTLTCGIALKDEYADQAGTYAVNRAPVTMGTGETETGVMVSVEASLTLDYTPPTVPTATHTVRWVNWNGVQLAQVTVNNGEDAPAYPGATPVRPSTAAYTYTFRGWSAPAVDDDGNVTYTAQFTSTPVYEPTPTPGGGGGGGTTTIPDTPAPLDPGTTITDQDVPLANVMNLDNTDHFAYITGYEDGTVRPLKDITRAEVATIFFRLMTEEYRAANWATSNSFTDTAPDAWYNAAISTAAKAGILKGYTDGSVKPGAAITRAEFAAIAARFMSDAVTDDGTGDFSDTANHWAAREIRLAAKAGWVQGDGNLFRPDDPITRAEVMTMVNRMLDRVPDVENMLPDMKTWSDNPTDAWYYAAVQEATVDHRHERAEDGVTEIWTELTEEKDWDALLAAWTANNGASAAE